MGKSKNFPIKTRASKLKVQSKKVAGVNCPSNKKERTQLKSLKKYQESKIAPRELEVRVK